MPSANQKIVSNLSYQLTEMYDKASKSKYFFVKMPSVTQNIISNSCQLTKMYEKPVKVDFEYMEIGFFLEIHELENNVQFNLFLQVVY